MGWGQGRTGGIPDNEKNLCILSDVFYFIFVGLFLIKAVRKGKDPVGRKRV